MSLTATFASCLPHSPPRLIEMDVCSQLCCGDGRATRATHSAWYSLPPCVQLFSVLSSIEQTAGRSAMTRRRLRGDSAACQLTRRVPGASLRVQCRPLVLFLVVLLAIALSRGWLDPLLQRIGFEPFARSAGRLWPRR